MFSLLSSYLVFLGVIDSVDGEFMSVEINGSESLISVVSIHNFPCDVYEGKQFIFQNINGKHKIICLK
tara:strand:+ start:246 stop:449 length:204 start_codon:yes stop_codon:yes gene_type:complete